MADLSALTNEQLNILAQGGQPDLSSFSDEQLKAAAAAHDEMTMAPQIAPQQDTLLAAAQPPSLQGFFGREGEDLSKRAQQMNDAGTAYQAGDKSMGRAAYDIVGAYGNGLGDLIGNVAGSVGRAGRDVFNTAGNAIGGEDFRRGNQVLNQLGSQAGNYMMQPSGNPMAPSPGDVVRYAGDQYNKLSSDTQGVLNDTMGALQILPAAKMFSTAGEAALKPAIESLATPKNLPVNADDLRNIGGQAYKAATASGEVYSKGLSDKLLSSIEESKPKPIAGAYLSKEDMRYIDSVDEFKVLKDKNLSIDEVNALDQNLSNKISEAYRRGENYDAGKLGDIQAQFRNTIEDFPSGEKLKEARSLWSKNYKMQDVERIFKNAELSDNPATAIKSGFRTLAMNARKMKAYSPAEIKLIEKAAKTGAGTDILKVMGSRLNPIFSAAVGGLDSGAASYVGSAISRSGAGYLQGRRGMRVANKITEGITKQAEPNLVNRTAQRLVGKQEKVKPLSMAEKRKKAGNQ